jgi:hypothetical protein
MEQSVLLARIADKALARVCPSGCIHVSYGGITLDFGVDGFHAFVRSVNPERLFVIGPWVELQYCRVTLRFTSSEFREFAAMVAEAWERYLRLELPLRTALADGTQRAH